MGLVCKPIVLGVVRVAHALESEIENGSVGRIWKPIRAIHCNSTHCKFSFYIGNFHSTMESFIVKFEISILPKLLPFHFSTLLAFSDLQTFILPFSTSLSRHVPL